MKNLKLLLVAVLALFVATAFASPLFGTWKGGLNGRPITIVLSYADRHVDGKMLIDAASGARELRLLNPRIVNSPPSTIRFQVPNQDGTARLVPTAGKDVTFELEWTGGDQGLLRIVGEGASAAPIKMVKQPQ